MTAFGRSHAKQPHSFAFGASYVGDLAPAGLNRPILAHAKTLCRPTDNPRDRLSAVRPIDDQVTDDDRGDCDDRPDGESTDFTHDVARPYATRPLIERRPRLRRAGLDIAQCARSQIHAGSGLPANRYRSLNSSVPPQRRHGRISPLTGRSAAPRSCDKRRVRVPMWRLQFRRSIGQSSTVTSGLLFETHLPPRRHGVALIDLLEVAV